MLNLQSHKMTKNILFMHAIICRFTAFCAAWDDIDLICVPANSCFGKLILRPKKKPQNDPKYSTKYILLNNLKRFIKISILLFSLDLQSHYADVLYPVTMSYTKPLWFEDNTLDRLHYISHFLPKANNSNILATNNY